MSVLYYASVVFKKSHSKAVPAKACHSGRRIGSSAKPKEENAHLKSSSLCERMWHKKDLPLKISGEIV